MRIRRKPADHFDVALEDQNQLANSMQGDLTGVCRFQRSIGPDKPSKWTEAINTSLERGFPSTYLSSDAFVVASDFILESSMRMRRPCSLSIAIPRTVARSQVALSQRALIRPV